MSGAQLTLTEADDGKSVELRAGDTLVVRLHENPTTGFRWALDDPVPKIVRVRGSEYLGQSDAVGSGGDVLWSLEAVMPGKTQIAFKLWRHWEGDISIRKRFAVPLSIKA